MSSEKGYINPISIRETRLTLSEAGRNTRRRAYTDIDIYDTLMGSKPPFAMYGSTCESTVCVVGTNVVASHSRKPEVRVAQKILRKFKDLTTRKIWPKNHPDHIVDWSDDKVWAKIREQGCYHKAEEILVSCGTVTIHQAESPRPKVLVIYNSNIGIFQLPKGRKDFGEGFLAAALRETTEETGVAIRPLRLRFGSRSTPPATQCGMEDESTGVTECLNNETIGVSEYPDPATGAWRNIHWYAAKSINNTKRDDSRMPGLDKKKFSTFWFTEGEALARLKLDDERYMVRVAFSHIRKMSVEDWNSNEEEERLQDAIREKTVQ
ncbi:hypothetical protein F5Y15DRAFT_391711 [Xylariaceae sp. FL0016]|nr:hypothetical protein F5Y15DRAFT_391711 [Xylariaceae sp. FL0016]